MKNTPLYIAKRYLIARKGSTAVTFITWLAAIAMTVAVAAMFIIVSVFSGLEELNRELISDLHADLTIKSKSGKTLKDIPALESVLKKEPSVAAYSKVIEEKVYIDYSGKGDIAVLRGVDSAYTSVNPIHKNVFYGTYPSFKYSNEVLMEHGLNNRLAVPVGDGLDFATVFMPKAGTGLIQKEEDIFNKKDVYVSGVFSGNDQLNNYIIGPIEITQQLLELPKNAAYQIVIQLKDPAATDKIKKELQQKLGSPYTITTKNEENAAFWKMINIEKLFIYLIFGLVILITTFNLAGAIIILQLDKKNQSLSLISLGFPLHHLRRTYFFTGLLIVFAGIVSGLIIGTLICLLQLQTGIFMANPTLPFPVKIEPINYVLVTLTAGGFGFAVSWLFSKINRRYIIRS